MRKLNLRQKGVLAEFLGNFALAWITFGLISPVFTKIDDPTLFITRSISSLILTFFSLKFALDLVK